MVKLVEIVKDKSNFLLREVFVNPRHIISLREDSFMKQNLQEGSLPQGLDLRQDFTRITLDKGTVGVELTVVGKPSMIESKLNSGKELLHG